MNTKKCCPSDFDVLDNMAAILNDTNQNLYSLNASGLLTTIQKPIIKGIWLPNSHQGILTTFEQNRQTKNTSIAVTQILSAVQPTIHSCQILRTACGYLQQF